MQKHGFTYARYMDDLVVLTPTRARLRKAIKGTYQALKPWGYIFYTLIKNIYWQNNQGFLFLWL
jgi:hypothetical protein